MNFREIFEVDKEVSRAKERKKWEKKFKKTSDFSIRDIRTIERDFNLRDMDLDINTIVPYAQDIINGDKELPNSVR